MNGLQKDALVQIMKEAFDPFSIQPFVSKRLDRNFLHFGGIYNNSFDIILLNLVEKSVQEEWNLTLVDALLAERPKNIKLQKFALSLMNNEPEAYDAAPAQSLSLSKMEALVDEVPMLDIDLFELEMARCKRAVCRIQLTNKDGTRKWGTGFLIAPDLLMTNYHVVEAIIKGDAKPETLIFKFDFAMAAGNTVNPGVEYTAAPGDPVLAYSPYCEFDVKGSQSVNVDWPTNCLDYAVVKLKDPVGNHPFGPNIEKVLQEGGPFEKRGWLTPVNGMVASCEEGNIIIIQHPDKQPKKIAIGLKKIVGCDPKRQRVRYKVNTMGGSSGSPCFDHEFNLIALHNMGDEDWNDKYNQGILIENIFNDLQSKNIL